VRLSICAIFRNEAPYLREWIEFHRIVGVERFYLYQNRSDDDWEAVLRSYVHSGIVEVTDWPAGPPAQQAAYQHLIDRRRGAEEWVAFLDCDEFLFSPAYATVGEALDGEKFGECGAVAAHWMCFGASGHERSSSRPVIERFTTRPRDGFEFNYYVKCVVRMDRVEAATPSAHQFVVRLGTVNERGETVADVLHSPPTHQWLRINHYATKSREEFLRRIIHGRVDQSGNRHAGEFDVYQGREVDDREIWRFLPELKRRLAALGP